MGAGRDRFHGAARSRISTVRTSATGGKREVGCGCLMEVWERSGSRHFVARRDQSPLVRVSGCRGVSFPDAASGHRRSRAPRQRALITAQDRTCVDPGARIVAGPRRMAREPSERHMGVDRSDARPYGRLGDRANPRLVDHQATFAGFRRLQPVALRCPRSPRYSRYRASLRPCTARVSLAVDTINVT
jgi:hypothetical protein